MENINLKTALLNEQYEKIALFGENNDRKTWLVRQKNSNKIFVLKEIEIENISIYESLQYIKNRHLAAVKNIIEIENKAVVIEEYISGDILADKIENKNITKVSTNYGLKAGESAPGIQFVTCPVCALGGGIGGAGYLIGDSVIDLFRKGQEVTFVKGTKFQTKLTQPIDIPVN